MRVFLRLLLGLAMVAAVIGAAWALRGWMGEGWSQKSSGASMEPATTPLCPTLPGTNTAGEMPVLANAPQRVPPSCLDLVVLRSEVSATGTSALVKVRVRVRNIGRTPVPVGRGTFWLLAGGSPHFDLTQREPTEPTMLEPAQAAMEFAPVFIVSPYALLGSLTLLAGPATTNLEDIPKLPTDPIQVLVKEQGKPKGPFLDREWKVYTGTRWQ